MGLFCTGNPLIILHGYIQISASFIEVVVRKVLDREHNDQITFNVHEALSVMFPGSAMSKSIPLLCYQIRTIYTKSYSVHLEVKVNFYSMRQIINGTISNALVRRRGKSDTSLILSNSLHRR